MEEDVVIVLMDLLETGNRVWSCLSHQVGDVFDVLSVLLLCSHDAQPQGQPVSYRHSVGPHRDEQEVRLEAVEGVVRLNCDLLFGLLLWSEAILDGLSLGRGEKNPECISFRFVVLKRNALFSLAGNQKKKIIRNRVFLFLGF